MSQKNVDLVLINPGGSYRNYQSLHDGYTAVEPPVWIALIASFIRNKGFSVCVIDQNAMGYGHDKVSEMASEMNPVLTCVVIYGHNPSASTQNMIGAGELCRAIKTINPELNLLMAGGHVAACPEQTLIDEAVDYVCTGEGPYTIYSLIDELKKGSRSDFSRVPALMYRNAEAICSTYPAPLIANLDDELPEMAWDLLPMDRYRAHTWHCYGGHDRKPYAALYTTLGCPFNCTFCCIQAPFRQGEHIINGEKRKSSYRMWSVGSVIRQIDMLVNEYGVRNIKIADEMFVYDKQHVNSICDAIIDRGYDLNIWAYARVDTVDNAFLERLKKAGFRWLCFGIEAADKRVRNGVRKGTSNQKIKDTLSMVRDAGIHIGANYIFGLPEDDLESMQDTLDLAMDINAEFSNFYCAMAYPGSDLYDLALEKKWPLPENWGGYAQFSEVTHPLPTRTLKSSDVLRFRDRAFQVYHRNPAYLDMISTTFGSGAVEEIRELSSRPLVRKNI